MTAINHAITGSIVVASISNPIVGLPLAILSHFALDALPHFGNDVVSKPGSRDYKAVVIFDTFMTTSFIVMVALAGYSAGWAWWLLPLAGMLAWMPDIMWYKHYQGDIQGVPDDWHPVQKMHKKIQRYETSWGWIVEVLWFAVGIMLLSYLIFR